MTHHLLPHHADGPPKTADSAGQGFNARLALRITAVVGTMWCAYGFALLAGFGFPGLLGDSVLKYVLWTSTIFLQLVLLSVIMVGQNVSGAAADKRAEATFLDTEAILAATNELKALLVTYPVRSKP